MKTKTFYKATRQAEMRIVFGPDRPSDNVTKPCLMFVTDFKNKNLKSQQLSSE